MQNHVSAFTNALEQFKAKIEKDDFGLESKDDKDRIKKAEDLLTSELADAIKDWGRKQQDP